MKDCNFYCCDSFKDHALTDDDDQFIGYTADWEGEQGYRISGGIYGDQHIIINYCPFCGVPLKRNG